MNKLKRIDEKSKIFEGLLTQKEKVFHICLGYSKSPLQAEELAQDVYLKALRKIGSLKNSNLLEAWLFRIAKNTCLDYMKKSRLNRFRHLIKGECQTDEVSRETPESQVIYKEKLQSLKRTIRKLPAKNREVFILREYGNLSYQEIAATLRIKEGTVMSRLNRARQFVINRMKGEVHGK